MVPSRRPRADFMQTRNMRSIAETSTMPSPWCWNPSFRVRNTRPFLFHLSSDTQGGPVHCGRFGSVHESEPTAYGLLQYVTVYWYIRRCFAWRFRKFFACSADPVGISPKIKDMALHNEQLDLRDLCLRKRCLGSLLGCVWFTDSLVGELYLGNSRYNHQLWR